MPPLRPEPLKLEPLADMAKQYVALVEGDLGGPDGLGQYVHEVYGVSHHMLFLMQVAYGAKQASDAVDKAFYERKGK